MFRLQCDPPWFYLLKSGVKPVEGRKNTPKYQKIQVGDPIEFFWGDESFQAIVTQIRRYDTLEDYLKDVTIQKALPGVASFEDAVRIYLQWSSREEIENLGFLGIFIVPI